MAPIVGFCFSLVCFPTRDEGFLAPITGNHDFQSGSLQIFPLSFAAPYRKKGAHALGLRLGGKLSVADVVRRFLASRTVPFPQDF